MKYLFGFTFLSIFIFSCYSAPINSNNNRVYTSISEYLQSIPGVRVVGGGDNDGYIRLTGIGTSTTKFSDTSPLFVVDGQQVGRSLSGLANILNPNDIRRVKVLRAADQTSFYGINGANGVIEITTKK